jgi:septal ring factor EnvC (AmiA/AmiB activator)
MTSRKFLIGSIVLLLAAMPPAAAQTKKQLEDDKAKVEREIKKLNSDLEKARKNSRSGQQQLRILENKIGERTRLINNLDGQVNLLNIRMAETEDSIRYMQTQIDSLKHEYGRAVRLLYRQRGNLDQMALLLDTKAYNSAYLRMKHFHHYSRYRRRQAAAIRQKENELNNVTQELLLQQRQHTTLIEQQRQQREELAREQKQQQRQLNDSKQKEKKLQQQIAQKEKQKRQLQQQIQRIINEEIEKARKKKNSSASNAGTSSGKGAKVSDADIALSNDFASNRGKLPWPVAYTKVERPFGRYTHPSGGQNFNNGIDLLCKPGTAVKCVFNGTVSSVFTGPDGTKGIIVRHGNYMTVYAHLGTVTVSKGTNVKTGQNLGTVYSDPSGNAEFSFQLWNEKNVQDPSKWLR